MTVKEFNTLKKGDRVYYSIGNGVTQYAIFQKPTKETSFGKMTLSDLMNNKIDFSHGKEQMVAWVKYRNDYGRECNDYVSIRKLHKAQDH